MIIHKCEVEMVVGVDSVAMQCRMWDVGSLGEKSESDKTELAPFERKP